MLFDSSVLLECLLDQPLASALSGKTDFATLDNDFAGIPCATVLR